MWRDAVQGKFPAFFEGGIWQIRADMLPVIAAFYGLGRARRRRTTDIAERSRVVAE
jgi:hypothetical protein